MLKQNDQKSLILIGCIHANLDMVVEMCIGNLVVAYSDITGCLLTGGLGTKNSNHLTLFSLSN